MRTVNTINQELMVKRPLLGVNVDHVATIRQARGTNYPDPVEAALIAEQAGADYITMHLREDRRHIQNHDILRLMQAQQTYLNLEVAITDEMLNFAIDAKPQDCCLVPEKREELTTEGGLDVVGQKNHVAAAVNKLDAANIRTSLFIDPDESQITAAAECGAKVVEFHTGHYADANSTDKPSILAGIESSFAFANECGLIVNAGHGLTLENVSPIVSLPYVEELNIGHSIVARAIIVGFDKAVSEMKAAIDVAKN